MFIGFVSVTRVYWVCVYMSHVFIGFVYNLLGLAHYRPTVTIFVKQIVRNAHIGDPTNYVYINMYDTLRKD